MTATETDVLESLAAALRHLAACTSDSSVISSASHYARLLEATTPPHGEYLVRRIRDALNQPKTDFTDSTDHSEPFRAARDAAYASAKAAINYYVGLRRPDLATVVSIGREA